MPEVTIAHDAVPGRVRFRIPSIIGMPRLTEAIQDRIRHAPGILAGSASALTGSLLVRYDPLITNPATLQALLQATLPTTEGTSAGEASSTNPSKPLAPLQVVQRREVWHNREAQTVATQLGTSLETGLSAHEALRRIRVYGPNEVPDIPRRSRGAIFVDQAVSVPILMLSAAAVVSLMIGAAVDAVFILGALAANIGLGYYTEDRAEQTIHSLRQTRGQSARVLREGVAVRVEIAQIVPGDILLLEPGDVVSADGRVGRSESLVLDESLLTGESTFLDKVAKALQKADIPIADRANMVYAGSGVTGGRGAAIVTETALGTELGRIRTMIKQAPDTPPPMSRELHRLGGTLALAAGAVCMAFGGIGLLMGMPALEVLAIVASLAVSAIPEGLPTVATTTLALGMKRMRQHNAVVRRLPAIAALGSATMLCIDKTGTLTENKMRLRHLVLADENSEVTGALAGGDVRFLRNGQLVSPDDDPLLSLALRIGALCTQAQLRRLPGGQWEAVGSPTEQALLLAAVASGIDVPGLQSELKLKERRERAEGRNYMATIHEGPAGGLQVFVKGAPEEVLALCQSERTASGTAALTNRLRKQILAHNDRLASEGARILGLAHAYLPTGQTWQEDRHGLEWIGLCALEDPLRNEARGAIQQMAGAGIRTLMLTGDQRRTAEAVGRAAGLGDRGNVVVADAHSIGEWLASNRPLPDVLARVSPEHKYQIVRLLQQRGHIVMMTGDGINDAPALKAADIGIAMGVRSTQIARDISDVVLLDDNLESLPVAVSLGRTIFSNIRRALRFLLASNLADIMLVGACLALGLSFPLTALQLLWMNLVSDVFPAIALAMEPAEAHIMAQKPRPVKEPLLTSTLWKLITREAAVIAAATLASYLWGIGRYGLGARARTIAFTTICLSEILYALACRTEGRDRPGERRPPNPSLTTFLGISASAQIGAVALPPLRSLLGTTVLSPEDWLVVAAFSGLAVGLTKALKWLPSRSAKRLPAPKPHALLSAPATQRGSLAPSVSS